MRCIFLLKRVALEIVVNSVKKIVGVSVRLRTTISFPAINVVLIRTVTIAVAVATAEP